jgi:hypothetical protein
MCNENENENSTIKMPERKMVMIIIHPALVEDGNLVSPEIHEYYNCPKCQVDIPQEEIDALHCNSCNEDITKPLKQFMVWGEASI